MKTILLESQLQKTVGTEPVMFHHIIQFYLAVGLFTQSETSALANKYMKTCIILPFEFFSETGAFDYSLAIDLTSYIKLWF